MKRQRCKELHQWRENEWGATACEVCGVRRGGYVRNHYLTPNEHRIVLYLRHRGTVCSPREIVLEALGYPASCGPRADSRVFRVHIANIRGKLGQDAVRTYRGKGYGPGVAA